MRRTIQSVTTVASEVILVIYAHPTDTYAADLIYRDTSQTMPVRDVVDV
jgi:hypothetical protein